MIKKTMGTSRKKIYIFWSPKDMSWDLIIYTTKNYVTKRMKVTSTFYGFFLCKENDLDIVWK